MGRVAAAVLGAAAINTVINQFQLAGQVSMGLCYLPLDWLLTTQPGMGLDELDTAALHKGAPLCL